MALDALTIATQGLLSVDSTLIALQGLWDGTAPVPPIPPTPTPTPSFGGGIGGVVGYGWPGQKPQRRRINVQRQNETLIRLIKQFMADMPDG